MIIGVDVDGVICDLHAPWLAAYNADYPEQPLKREDCSAYDLAKVVSPRCGRKIYDYLNIGDLYETAPKLPGAIEGVWKLRKAGHRVVFVTSTGRALSHLKRAWLEKYGFLKQAAADDHRPDDDFVNMSDKSLFYGDALVEDNVNQLFRFRGQLRVLLDQPWNQPHSVPQDLSPLHRCYDWPAVVAYIIAATDPSVLTEAQGLVHGARNVDYGHPAVNDARIAALMRAQFGWDVKNTDIWQLMVITKLARERNKPKRDNRVDIAGYAEVGDWIHRDGRAEP